MNKGSMWFLMLTLLMSFLNLLRKQRQKNWTKAISISNILDHLLHFCQNINSLKNLTKKQQFKESKEYKKKGIFQSLSFQNILEHVQLKMIFNNNGMIKVQFHCTPNFGKIVCKSMITTSK